jgi:hypothetical protein
VLALQRTTNPSDGSFGDNRFFTLFIHCPFVVGINPLASTAKWGSSAAGIRPARPAESNAVWPSGAAPERTSERMLAVRANRGDHRPDGVDLMVRRMLAAVHRS